MSLSLRGASLLIDKKGFFERLSERMHPFDHLAVIYCWLIITLTINLARPIEDYLFVLAFHLGVIALVTTLAWYLHGISHRLAVFFRLLYPVMLMVFFYTASGRLVHIIFPAFLDYQVVILEEALLGYNPTLWLDQHLNVVVTEILSASYFSYYFLIPGLALVMFFAKRDDEIKRFLTATCSMFFVSYMIFIFYPVEGPRHFFAAVYENSITGPFFRNLVNMVIDNGAFHGGAMPSSHCGEALIVAFFAIRTFGRRAWFLAPVVFLLSLGTVYGRFHYLSDVVVGHGLAVIAIWLTLYFYPVKKDSASAAPEFNTVLGNRYVSRNS